MATNDEMVFTTETVETTTVIAPKRHILLVGAPGSGKMIAARDHYERLSDEFKWALPDSRGDLQDRRSQWEYAERIAQVKRHGTGYIPFRAPHFTVSERAMFGRLDWYKWEPGEVSLAHGGVLLLDDIAAFNAPLLERLKRVVETGMVELTSGENHLRVPALPRIIATAVPMELSDEYLTPVSRAPFVALLKHFEVEKL